MARRAAPAIRTLPFRHNRKPGLGFEIFRLSELVARADGRTRRVRVTCSSAAT